MADPSLEAVVNQQFKYLFHKSLPARKENAKRLRWKGEEGEEGEEDTPRGRPAVGSKEEESLEM
jgi:hypothetical protein